MTKSTPSLRFGIDGPGLEGWRPLHSLKIFSSAECATISAQAHPDQPQASMDVDWNPENSWIFDRLTTALTAANKHEWRLDLSDLASRLTLVRQTPGQAGAEHLDIASAHIPTRKLTLVVPLTPEENYQGGDLTILQGDQTPAVAPRKAGTLTVFPSYLTYRNQPVTSGQRLTLMGWAHGHPFR